MKYCLPKTLKHWDVAITITMYDWWFQKCTYRHDVKFASAGSFKQNRWSHIHKWIFVQMHLYRASIKLEEYHQHLEWHKIRCVYVCVYFSMYSGQTPTRINNLNGVLTLLSSEKLQLLSSLVPTETYFTSSCILSARHDGFCYTFPVRHHRTMQSCYIASHSLLLTIQLFVLQYQSIVMAVPLVTLHNELWTVFHDVVIALQY